MKRKPDSPRRPCIVQQWIQDRRRVHRHREGVRQSMARRPLVQTQQAQSPVLPRRVDRQLLGESYILSPLQRINVRAHQHADRRSTRQRPGPHPLQHLLQRHRGDKDGRGACTVRGRRRVLDSISQPSKHRTQATTPTRRARYMVS